MLRHAIGKRPRPSTDERLSIALFASLRYGSSHYRAFAPLNELERRGHRVIVVPDVAAITSGVASCDVAFVHRYQGKGAERLVRDLRRAGLGIVWEHDDNVSASPEHRDGGIRAQRAAAGVKAMVNLADVVTTTSPLLADTYRAAGAKQVHVIENYLPRAYETAVAKSGRRTGVLIGWIAWADHQRDWDNLGLRAVMEAVLSEHQDVYLASVGPVDLGVRSERYRRVAAVDFSNLPNQIAQFDLGLAPLVDSLFNRCRSNIKIKEYAGLGVPWIASPVGPYAALGESQGGRLAADSEWRDRVCALVEDARVRRRLGHRGKRWSRMHTLAANSWRWECALQEALSTARKRAND